MGAWGLYLAAGLAAFLVVCGLAAVVIGAVIVAGEIGDRLRPRWAARRVERGVRREQDWRERQRRYWARLHPVSYPWYTPGTSEPTPEDLPMSDRVTVVIRPDCDPCRLELDRVTPARYDARTVFGSWAYLCRECFERYGIGLGTGLGQELVVETER